MSGLNHGDASSRRTGRALVALVFVAIWGLMTHGTRAGTGDEPHYMMIAHSLAFDGDLDLANNYRDATLIARGTLEPEHHAIWRGGRLRPVHDIGMPLVFAPVLRLAYPLADRAAEYIPARLLEAGRLNEGLLLRHQMSLVMALVTGVLSHEVWLALRAAGHGRGAFGWALLFALTPPVLSHSFLFFTEILSACVTFAAFRRLAFAGVRTNNQAVLVGGLTGFLLLVHARNVGIAIGLSALALRAWRREGWPAVRLASFCAGAAVLGIVRAALTYTLWGTLISTPHAAFNFSTTAAGAATEILVRATGLLFDREYGLLAYAPIYLLAFPGFARLAGSERRLAADSAVVFGCYVVPVLLPFVNVHGWTGGWSPAARFLVPVAALLWLPASIVTAHVARGARIAALAIVAVQVAINLYLWQVPRSLWNDGDGISAFWWAGWMPTWFGPAANPWVFGTAVIMTAACALWLAKSAVRE
jgi:hypothetical protein